MREVIYASRHLLRRYLLHFRYMAKNLNNGHKLLKNDSLHIPHAGDGSSRRQINNMIIMGCYGSYNIVA